MDGAFSTADLCRNSESSQCSFTFSCYFLLHLILFSCLSINIDWGALYMTGQSLFQKMSHDPWTRGKQLIPLLPNVSIKQVVIFNPTKLYISPQSANNVTYKPFDFFVWWDILMQINFLDIPLYQSEKNGQMIHFSQRRCKQILPMTLYLPVL